MTRRKYNRIRRRWNRLRRAALQRGNPIAMWLAPWDRIAKHPRHAERVLRTQWPTRWRFPSWP